MSLPLPGEQPRTWSEAVGYLLVHPRTLALVALLGMGFMFLDCHGYLGRIRLAVSAAAPSVSSGAK